MPEAGVTGFGCLISPEAGGSPGLVVCCTLWYTIAAICRILWLTFRIGSLAIQGSELPDTVYVARSERGGLLEKIWTLGF